MSVLKMDFFETKREKKRKYEKQKMEPVYFVDKDVLTLSGDLESYDVLGYDIFNPLGSLVPGEN